MTATATRRTTDLDFDALTAQLDTALTYADKAIAAGQATNLLRQMYALDRPAADQVLIGLLNTGRIRWEPPTTGRIRHPAVRARMRTALWLRARARTWTTR